MPVEQNLSRGRRPGPRPRQPRSGSRNLLPLHCRLRGGQFGPGAVQVRQQTFHLRERLIALVQIAFEQAILHVAVERQQVAADLAAFVEAQRVGQQAKTVGGLRDRARSPRNVACSELFASGFDGLQGVVVEQTDQRQRIRRLHSALEVGTMHFVHSSHPQQDCRTRPPRLEANVERAGEGRQSCRSFGAKRRRGWQGRGPRRSR